MDIPKETLRQCADLGFAACRWPALREFANAIFAGVRAQAPDNPAWYIGMGMVQAISDGDPDAACKFMMQQGVSRDSGDLLARAFLGLFLVMAKRSNEAEQVAQAVIDDGSDAQAAAFAQAVLDNEIRG